MTDKGCTRTHARHNNSQTQITQHHPTHLTHYTHHVLQCCLIYLHCSFKHPQCPHPHAVHIPARHILIHTHTDAQLAPTSQACHNTHDIPSATHWSLRSYSLPPTPLCSMRNTPRLCGDGRKGREQARACLCSFFRMWVSSHLWKLRCGGQARGVKVKDQVTDLCERLKAGVRHKKWEIQNHRTTRTGRLGQRAKGGRQVGSFLPPAPRTSAQSCTLTRPHPSLLSFVAIVTGRQRMQQRRLGLQIWPVSMETGGGGGATSSSPGSWPLCGTLSPFKRRMGGKGGGSVPPLSFSSLPYPAGMSLDHGREIGGMEKPEGFQDPRRFLAFSPPAHQLGWGRLHPRQAHVPPHALPPQFGETDDCA